MKRIQETRHKPTGGMITDRTPKQVRVREIEDDAPLPENAQEVPAKTPLSDWTEEN